MPKKKSNDKSKVVSFNPDRDFDLLASLMKDVGMNHLNQASMDDNEEFISQLAASTINSAINLSKLVIDNRIHNSQKMNDEDIYKIFNNSFKSIMKTASEDPMN